VKVEKSIVKVEKYRFDHTCSIPKFYRLPL